MLCNPRPSCCGAEVLLRGLMGLQFRPDFPASASPSKVAADTSAIITVMVGSFSTSNGILINSSACSAQLRQNHDTAEPWSSLQITYVHLKMEWPCFRVCDTGRMTQRYSTHFELAFNFGERGTHITAGSRGHELDP